MFFPRCRDSKKTSRKATAILAMARDDGWTERTNDRVPDRAAETAPRLATFAFERGFATLACHHR